MIGIGIIILIGGVMVTLSGTNYFYQLPDEFISNYEQNRLIDITTRTYNAGEADNPTKITFKIIFKTEDAFAVDNRIDIISQAKISGPQHEKEIYLFIDDFNINYTAINTETFRTAKNHAGNNSGILELKFIDNTDDGSRLYEKEGYISYNIEQNLSFLPVVIGPNNQFGSLPIIEDLLTIGPAHTKIQAEAAKADLKNAIEQDKSNKIVIGLTLVIISIMLLAVPADFYLVDNRKNSQHKGEIGDKGSVSN